MRTGSKIDLTKKKYRKNSLFAFVMIASFILLSQVTISTDKTVKIERVLRERYENSIPESVNINIVNNEAEPEFLNYVFIKSVDAPIRKEPSTHSKEIARFPYNTKINVLEKIETNGNEWYKVELRDKDGDIEEGYVSAILVELRQFRFEEMTKRIGILSKFLKSESSKGKELVSTNTYAPNPNNANMSRVKDKYGISQDQNAQTVFNGEIINIPDRSIAAIEYTKGNDVFLDVLSIPEKPLKVDKSVISKNPKIDVNFRKAIMIDLKNENQGIFQKNSDDEWELISYTLSKTGLESTLGFETPRGYFIVPVVKYEMFFKDEFNRTAGMAKHAIRFSGGGYLHGTPILFEEDINRDFFLREKDGTLGTVSGTRKCIRNMESHIKFLFDWVTNGKTNSKSNEQRPDENVMVIIF